MNNKHWIILAMILLPAPVWVCAQERVLYKEVDTTKLFLKLYYPEGMSEGVIYPAMVSIYLK
jgi:hypothetical protein